MEKKERVFQLTDLFAMLLKSAGFILCIALVFAVFGALRTLIVLNKNSSVTAAQLEQYRQDYEDAQNALEFSENTLQSAEIVQIRAHRQDIEWTNEKIVRLQDHIDNSLLMALDPDFCPEARTSFILDYDQDSAAASPGEEINALFAESTEIPGSSGMRLSLDADTLKEVGRILNLDAEPQYIREIATVTYDPEKTITVIKVCHSDTEAARKAVDYLSRSLEKKLDTLIDEYRITPLESFCGIAEDPDVKNDQLALMAELHALSMELFEDESRLLELRDRLTERNTEVESLRMAFLTARNKLEEAERKISGPGVGVSVSRGAIFRKAVVFGLTGLLFGCIAAMVKGLFGKTLQNHSEFSARYPYPLLGVLPRKKKYLFEKLIRKLEGEGGYSYDAAAQAAAQSLLAAAGERSVCLVSSLGEGLTGELAPYVDGRFKSCGDILGEADAVKALADYDGVILVEKRGKSNIDLIDSEALRIKALGKEIIGAILT